MKMIIAFILILVSAFFGAAYLQNNQNERQAEWMRACVADGGTPAQIGKGFFTTQFECLNPQKETKDSLL